MLLTIEQVNEKYADIDLKFSSYYKYEFTFTARTTDNYFISVTYGGQIYRYEVDADKPKKFGACSQWQSVEIYTMDPMKSVVDAFSYRAA